MHIELESLPAPSVLPAVYHKSPRGHAQTPGHNETDPNILKNQDNKSSWESGSPGPQPYSVPSTPGELEDSRPTTPGEDAVGMVQSIDNPNNKARLFSSCLLILNNGLSDAAPGALIPYLEKYYDIGYTIVSLIFLGTAAGFIVSAFFSEALYSRFGRAKVIIGGSIVLAIAFTIMAIAPPFGAVVFAFFLIGAGQAVILAQVNVFVTGLANSTVLLGWLHGSYGVGGTISPLLATAMATAGIQWNNFYWILMGFSLVNCAFGGWIFWNSEKDSHLPAAASVASMPTSKRKILQKSLLDKATIMTSLYIFAYQGVEVSNSGWVVSFLMTNRDSVDTSKVGYVAAGFWAGITLGRFLLSYVCRRFGEKETTYVFIAGAFLFEILIWRIPNIVSNAISVFIVGFLLGPLYPCTMTVVTRMIPTNLHVSSLSLISAFGSSGGAISPFTTGILAGQFGPWVLYPVSLGLLAVMQLLWFFLSKTKGKRTD
ncbi:major facilitator superfamily domain-containing protein [Geopyxis carbonaria]|nr:major facilitator superfamily domain-containing protein [Geopyxis carbonaria]